MTLGWKYMIEANSWRYTVPAQHAAFVNKLKLPRSQPILFAGANCECFVMSPYGIAAAWMHKFRFWLTYHMRNTMKRRRGAPFRRAALALCFSP